MIGKKDNWICVILKGLDHSVLDSAINNFLKIAAAEKVKIEGPIPLPTKKKIWTVLRGVHIDKEAREQFERREHKRLFYVKGATPSFINAIGRHDLPSGVSVKINLGDTRRDDNKKEIGRS